MSFSGKGLYEFGPFRLDVGQHLLHCDGQPVALPPKAFDTLLALVEGEGKVVRKEELLAKIWPDTAVEEGSLAQNISILRKALREGTGGQQYIQTIPKRGYRFVVPVAIWIESNGHPPIHNPARASFPNRKHAVAVAAALVLAAGAIYLTARHSNPKSKPLTDKDVLVLADFTNTTADPVFDGTLREALTFQLEQSPFLKVLEDEAMRQDLELMRRLPQERVSNGLAREICLREGEKAVLGGSIVRMGASYIIELKATACETGATLARQQSQAADKDHVLQALAQAARKLRAELGESLASIQKLAPPEFQVSTNSLEAFQDFATGQKLFTETRYAESVPLFQRATELDSDFAMAYYWLASASLNSGGGGNPERVQEYADKAYALRDRVSAYERFWIGGPGFQKSDRVEALKNDELWARAYPRDPAPLALAALVHSQMGEFEDALRLDREAYQIAPRRRLYASAVVSDYIRLDRLADAKSEAAAHSARGFDDPQIHRLLLRMAWMERDEESAALQIQWFTGTPEEHIVLEDEAAHARMSGQIQQSHALLERAADLAQRRGLPDAAASLLAPNADGDALLGNCTPARNANAASAISLAFCGNAAMVKRARLYASDRSKWRAGDPLWSRGQLPLLDAAIEYRHGQPTRVIALLGSLKPYERAFPFATYLRGLAYLQLNRGPEASAEFQHVIDHQGADWGPLYPMSYVGLARGLVVAGNRNLARKAYENFFELWKDADTDVPILIQALKEYESLGRSASLRAEQQ